jgi:IS30 family transposase
MKGYKQLTPEQRYQIYALKKAGQDRTQMAKIVGVHKSTISREPRRNCGQRGYRAKQAQQMALARQPSRWRLHGNNKALTAPQSALRRGP